MRSQNCRVKFQDQVAPSVSTQIEPLSVPTALWRMRRTQRDLEVVSTCGEAFWTCCGILRTGAARFASAQGNPVSPNSSLTVEIILFVIRNQVTLDFFCTLDFSDETLQGHSQLILLEALASTWSYSMPSGFFVSVSDYLVNILVP